MTEGSRLRVALLTREYPPEVYGGAGVHVEYLARELDRLVDVTVHCFGADRRVAGPPAVAHRPWDPCAATRRTPPRSRRSRSTSRWQRRSSDAQLVHSHTWYANLGGPPREARARDPARGDGAQPRAAASVEGRAAGRRLRALVLVRADGARGRRRRHRGLGRAPPRPARLLPGGRPGAGERDRQRDRHRSVPTGGRHRPRRAERRRSGPALRPLRRPDHAPEGADLPARRRPADRPGCPARDLRGCARHAGARRGDRRQARAGRPGARRRRLDRADAGPAGADPAPLARRGLRLPLDLRTARDRQPRGDGLRDGGRRHGDRRHPGGRRGRGDGSTRPVRPGRRSVAGAARPGSVRPCDRRACEPAARRSGGGNAHGRGRARAGRRAVRLGPDRRAGALALRAPRSLRRATQPRRGGARVLR